MERILNHRLELLVFLCCLSLLAYFGWQASYGSRSFSYKHDLERRFSQTNADLNAIIANRKALDDKVAQMRPGSVDQDLVDELARKNLNLAMPSEIVVRLQ